jgi:Mg2+-importing ATPase
MYSLFMPEVSDLLKKRLDYFSSLSIENTYSLLSSSPLGLSSDQASKKHLQYGQNLIRDKKRFEPLLKFLSGFKSPLIIVLFIVIAASFLTGEGMDAIIVGLMVLLSVTLNFVQEYKADSAAQKLKQRVAVKVHAIRDGSPVELDSSEITVGDILELNAGDLIVADARLITSKDFFVNQSSLTGESFPVEKNKDAKDINNIIYCGTNVVTGSGSAVVLKIGEHTEFGKIAKELSKEKNENEFTRGVNSFSVMILRVIIFFVLFIFLVNAIVKQDILQSLMFSIAVAVGLTPEFLPMIMSVTMGIGSVKMAKNGVIVKKLTAIPTFGSLDILCTDKTGTLTEDNIKLVKYTNLSGFESEEVLLLAYLNSFFQTGITNPMDQAVQNFKKINVAAYEKLDEVPFDFERKMMSIVAEKDKNRVLITKGAPEKVFEICDSYILDGTLHTLDVNNSENLIKQYYDLSNEGYRVIAIAFKEVSQENRVYTKNDEKGLTLMGYTSFLDPPKEGVKASIDALEEMGIEMKVLTGDNELVARKICKDVDIAIKKIMLGSEVAEMSDDELRVRVGEVSIFARVSPDDKNRVIKALQANGRVVGYMGDGINDAPSLKTADIGISVENAVDVAKESADIILTRKSLDQLVQGVLEGRKIFSNTMKYIMMGISSNFGNMFSVLGAVIFLPFLPMLPIQILLNNFLYDVAQVTIPSDNVDGDFLRKPKKWDMGFIKKFMFIFGPISSFYDFVTFFMLFVLFKFTGGSFQTGWFMESLASQTLVIYFIRTKKIPFIQSSPSLPLLLSSLLVVTIGWLIPYLSFGKHFGMTPLPLYAVGSLLLVVLTYLATVQLGKHLFYKQVKNW